MTIALSTRIKRCPDQVSTELNGEVAILNLKSSQYYGLDLVGAVAWDSLSEPRQVDDICRAIMDRFDVEESVCRVDVLALLECLAKAGLIEVDGPAA
jgi:hypothetical protein